jgi:L-lactate dehydrogenase complex protein LldF
VTRVERFARELSPLRVASVRSATKTKTTLRAEALAASLGPNWEDHRERAAAIKDEVLADLEASLSKLEAACARNGIQVHHASDAASARQTILDIVRDHSEPGATVVKAKSMATEEIHLNQALEQAGYDVVETDLGEFVVQLDRDTPSHIVTPIIHKSRVEVAETFARAGLGPYAEEPTELAMQARMHLRSKFKSASIGISGVNFAIAETGKLVIVENEGNNRLSTTAPKVHIALMGLEKLLPDETCLAMFLKLLAASATNQFVTTYVHFVSGPRREDEPDGPEEVHLVLLDNGRRKVNRGPYREILRCIRCGACQNACPVYRQASGHGYGHVYAGPIGAVFAPTMEGVAAQGELSAASSLCGLCEEVCPVKIPIPEMLLRLRDENARATRRKRSPWPLFALAASDPGRWALAIAAVRMLGPFAGLVRGWSRHREPPIRTGRDFRRWWRGRR